MSILIKGIQMPTSCMLCPFCVEEADPANGEMCMATGTLMPPCTRDCLDNCPLVPVPEHGRLIDADNLLNTAFKLVDEETFRAFRQLVIDATTIIPAEESE